MTSTSYSDSSRAVLRSVGGQDYRFTPTYLRGRDPITPATSPDIRPKEQQGRYPINSLWSNTTNGNVWILLNYNHDGGTNRENTARWVLITSGSSGPVTQIAGDDGIAVSPDNVTGIINLTGIVVASATHAKAVFFQKNAAVNTEELDVQVTAAIAASDITKVGLAAFNNSEFTVDANGFVSLVGGGAAVEQFTVDYQPISALPPTPTGIVTPDSGNVTVTGGNGVVTEQIGISPNNHTYKVHALRDFEVTGTSATLVTNFSFTANNVGLVTITLPATAAQGDKVQVNGKGTGGWKIAQPAGVIVHFGNVDTTLGAGGHLDSTSQYDSVVLQCVVANTEWERVDASGTISVT